MNREKIFFILSLTGILLIILLAQVTKQTQTGKISSIKYSPNKITIQLENFEEPLILFDELSLNLKKGDKISFQGKEETYKNKKQIIVDKIWLTNN